MSVNASLTLSEKNREHGSSAPSNPGLEGTVKKTGGADKKECGRTITAKAWSGRSIERLGKQISLDGNDIAEEGAWTSGAAAPGSKRRFLGFLDLTDDEP